MFPHVLFISLPAVVVRLIRRPIHPAAGHDAARGTLDRAPLALLVAHPERLLAAIPVDGLALLELRRKLKQLACQVNVAPARAQRFRLHIGEGVACVLRLRGALSYLDGGVVALDNVGKQVAGSAESEGERRGGGGEVGRGEGGTGR
ncbi:hypothetical protein CRV24_008234 [Beauveria bassiana]|nr:hypothetical protein CRV24_008234 [Beauveria bassiana]